MKPMLDPARDLVGATPEKLARALLRNRLRPRPGGKPIVGDEVAVREGCDRQARPPCPASAQASLSPRMLCLPANSET